MAKRVLMAVALLLTFVGATALGVGGAGFRTGAGREVLARLGVAVLGDLLHGTAEAGYLGGSFTEGLEARDVVLRGEDGTLLARFPRVVMRYRFRDLLSGRIVLGQVILEDPFVNVVKRPKGRFNYQEVLGLGGPGGGGPDPFVAFHDAEIHNGTVVIHTPTDGPRPGEFEVEEWPDGWMRVRRVENLNARVAYARIASPFPGDRGLQFDIEELSVRLSDPAFDIRDMRGRLEIIGDSLAFDLDEVVLPGSVARLKGPLTWPGGPLLADLEIDAERVDVNDVAGIVSPLPWGLVGSGSFRVRHVDAEHLSFQGSDMRMRGPGGGGTLSGRLNVLLGPNGKWTVSDTELHLDSLGLDYVRPMVDTIPFAGRLTGRVTAEGPVDLLFVELDWHLYDSLVVGWPRSYIGGSGVVGLGAPDAPVFYSFQIDTADIDLGTVHHLFPVIGLHGRLGGTGRLNGPWQNIEFRGTLRHQDGSLATSVARGNLRLDSRGDTLGLWTDVTLDSLAFAGIHPSYPRLPERGTFAGRLNLAGHVDSLPFVGHLEGPGGEVTADGHLILLPGLVGVRNLDMQVARLNANAVHSGLWPTEFYGGMSGDVVTDSSSLPRGEFVLALDTSYVGGSPLDSLRGVIRMADSILQVDEVIAGAHGLFFMADGSVGLDVDHGGTLHVQADVDSLGGVESLLREVSPVAGESDVFVDMLGAASARMTVEGSLDDHRTEVVASVPQATSAGASIEALQFRASWTSERNGEVVLASALDSLSLGRWSFADMRFNVSGFKKTAAWSARTALGSHGSLVAGGRAVLDDGMLTVPFDSLELLLPTHRWSLDRRAVVTMSDEGFDLRDVTLTGGGGGAKVSLAGRVPRQAVGTLRGSLEALPLADVWALRQADPETVEGRIGGTFAVGGTARFPELHAALAVDNGRLGSFRTPHLEGLADYADGRLAGSYELWREAEPVVTVEFDLPMDLGLTDVTDRLLPGRLTVRAVAAEVDPAFAEFFTPLVREVGGRLDADVGITGTWEHPELTGSLAIADGRATFPELGVTHERINGRLILSGDTIRVDHMTLASGDGDMQIDGFVRLEGFTKPVMNLRFAADRFDTIDVPDLVALTISGDLALQGPVFGATLTGQGTITNGVVFFADLVEKEIVNLEDTLFVTLIDTSLTASRESAAAFLQRQGLEADFENRVLDSLRIDSLQLAMGSDVWLRSSEANIQLTGQVVAGKVADRYRLDGSLNTPRGVYRLPISRGTFLGDIVVRDFTVTDGTVQYFGTADLDAAIDINARHVVRTFRGDNITVFVNVGGTLYAPQLTLTSDIVPALPESEIISYLLFGASSVQALGAEPAGTQNRQTYLEFAAAEVLGGAFFGELERSLISDLGVPIDYLQIRPELAEGLTGFEVAVGRQFGSRAFVTVSPRYCPDQAFTSNVGISAEFRLSRQWHLAASSDPVRGCGTLSGPLRQVQQIGVDLFWEKRY